MIRRLPLWPTLLVGAAVAAMIALGFWQIRRADWKAGLIAHYEQARAMSAEVPWPRSEAGMEDSLFRWSSFDCERVVNIRTTAARSATNESGVAQIAHCALAGGGEAEVALGWSRPAEEFSWAGGPVSGMIGPGGEFGGTLYAAHNPGGLQPLAPPDPNDLPQNHTMYAVQWFFFALTALVIYVLALRKRWREEQ